jgi:acyl-homoserine-lactone acylase
MRLSFRLAVLALVACSSTRPSVSSDYRATIRWTSHGIPHVVADDLGSLAFGQGYAFASLHACVLADQIVKLRSERAKLFGPGDHDANIESDFGWLALDIRGQAERGLPKLSPDARTVLAGWAAGYNRYLADKRAALPADCAGASWMRSIDEVDLLAHWIQTSMLGSSAFFLESIAAARPPNAKAARRNVRLPDLSPPGASNGWAIGGDRSATGRGMLVANPHFPWEGELRFYESHLTIPGSLDAYGATLLGLPLLNIAFNKDLAWTHTFSSSRRFVIYRLELDPADPTRYRYGDETRAMTARDLTISVRQPDGSLVEVKRKSYRSHYGPMLGDGQLAWTAANAFTIRDVAGGGLDAIDQYLGMIRSRDLKSFEAALAHQATGFVNTIYADRDGNAMYVDSSAVPDLSPSALLALSFARKAMPAMDAAWKRGVVLADGSSPTFELVTDPASARPGAIAYSRAPRLVRRDFVMNANDPYWLANPAAPMTGFSPLYGETGLPPSERTRMNLRLLRTGDKFTVDNLQAAILDDRAMTAELLRADVVARCKNAKDARSARACETLAGWDGRYDVGSRGAILWRELVNANPGSLYAAPFDAANPIDTPRGLAPPPKTGDDPVIAALARAIERLDRAGVDPFGTLGEAQWVDKRGKHFPVPGSGPAEGATNPTFFSTSGNTTLGWRMARPDFINAATGLAKGGYPSNYGTSFLMVVGFTDAGPVARAMLTYSASSDPTSSHFADQTEMYARKQWRPVLFSARDIEADSQLRIETVCSPGC